MQSENHLRNFIFELSDLLRQDVDLKVDETLATLDKFRDQLDGLHANYDQDDPGVAPSLAENGTGETASLMAEAIVSFYSALDSLEEFIDEPKDELLDEAMKEADKGAVLLEKVMEMSSLQHSSIPLYGY